MVRLPDWQDLGAVPHLDARVPIARPDASAIARGAEQLGQGIAKLGQGVGQFARAQGQYQDALARGNLEADVIGLKQQYAEDADYSGLPQRFDADLQKLAQQHAETIDDPSMRQRFLADAAQFNAGHRAWADQHAFVIGKDAQKAYLDQAGQNFIKAAGSTADDAAHQRMIEAMDAALARAEHLGVLDREEAMLRRAAFTDQFLSVDTQSQIDRAIAAGDAEKLDQIVAGLSASRGRAGLESGGGTPKLDGANGVADAAQANTPLPDLPGAHFDMLSPAARDHLIGYATQRQQAAVIDQQRAVRQQQAQIQQASDQREDQLLTDITGPSPQATAQSIAGDPALTPQASERMIAFLGRDESVSPQASHIAAAGLLARVRPGYEGADKIGDLDPLYDAAIGDKITGADFNFLRAELASQRTPEGAALAKRQAEFMGQMAPVIQGPNSDLLDTNSQLRAYDFAQALSDEIARYRNEGKNPFDLFRRLPNESDEQWAARASGGRVSIEPVTHQNLAQRAAAAGLTDATGADRAEDAGAQPAMDGDSSQLHLGGDAIHAGVMDIFRLILARARALGLEKHSPTIFRRLDEIARGIQDPGAGIELLPSPPKTTAPPARPASTLAIEPEQKPSLIQRLRDVVSSALNNRTGIAKAQLGPVENPQELAEQAGLGVDLAGYQHTVDSDAIRHVLKQHGDAAVEAKRGQVAVMPEDFDLIPDILAAPDTVSAGGKTSRGLDAIVYQKQMGDTIYYVEQVRTGRRELAMVTMYKKRVVPAVDGPDVPGQTPDRN